MKTTININDALLRRAKRHAVEKGITLTALFEDALQSVVSKAEPEKPYRLKLFTVKDTGPWPFDVSSRAAMYEWFEQSP